MKTTIEELIDEIKKNIDVNLPVKYEGITPGDQFGIYCSYDLIKTELGWSPKIMLSEGIKIMIEWALKGKSL